MEIFPYYFINSARNIQDFGIIMTNEQNDSVSFIEWFRLIDSKEISSSNLRKFKPVHIKKAAGRYFQVRDYGQAQE